MERLRLWAAALILGIFAATIVVDAVNPAYDPPRSLDIPVGAVVGYLFAREILSRAHGKKEPEGGPPAPLQERKDDPPIDPAAWKKRSLSDLEQAMEDLEQRRGGPNGG